MSHLESINKVLLPNGGHFIRASLGKNGQAIKM